ncbi:GNAT family N-acetyltransferase [Stappia sp. ES.058]|uniref:GNAT family N-acetyltransferase n=1 Tax=Stappia sp. ES.058 TaxID=1881061 RepID=UPI00087D37AD|nr:GNAT family N-acetyltransferase [Stappia sp. ES.058]SDU46997.1 Acetyltransferase (GNAT) family protein [Stappia sp. ES.058]
MPHTSKAGSTGYYRKLTFADQARFRDHLLRLDPCARRARFAMPASDAFLRCYSETSFSLDAVLHGYVVDGHLRAVAELRPCGDVRTAEAAFSVEETCRLSGVGTRLMELTLIAARNRGCHHIYMNCLATNRAMQQLARKFTKDLTFEMGDIVGRIDPRSASPFSHIREQTSDFFGVLGEVVDGSRTLLRSRT